MLANYREDDRSVLSIEKLQDHLQTAALRYPKDQVLVFDTCGTIFDEYEFQQSLAYQTFGAGLVDRSCRQFLMFASEDGTVAVNRQGVGGTFTAELLASLKSLNSDEPADLRDVHGRMLLRFEDLQRRDPKVQRPILYTWRAPGGDGQENIALVPDRARRPEFVFALERAGDRITLKDPADRTREVDPPWRADSRFGGALRGFNTLTRQPVEDVADRAALFRHAAALGDALFGLLFDEEGTARLREALVPNGPRPLVLVRSGDDTLLSLPWELLRLDGEFLVREWRIDLARTTAGEVGPDVLPREPSVPFKLVVNVSAPEGSRLSYEAESYRLTRALTELCPLVPTELGTLDDLVATVAREQPTGIHFSGHGEPGRLVFEDDEGRDHKVAVDDLLKRLRDPIPDGKLPPFFYLANCHGNTPGEPEAGKPGSESLAARLHREGVNQVVGYYGPIGDELSTRAEEQLYAAIAEGHPTRFAVHRARAALAQPFLAPDSVLRDVLLVSPAADPAQTRTRSPGPSWSSTSEVRTTRSAGPPPRAGSAVQRTSCAVHTSTRATAASWRPASSAGVPTDTASVDGSGKGAGCSCSRGWAALAKARWRCTRCPCSPPGNSIAPSGARMPNGSAGGPTQSPRPSSASSRSSAADASGSTGRASSSTSTARRATTRRGGSTPSSRRCSAKCRAW